jgi:protein subunit release factor A
LNLFKKARIFAMDLLNMYRGYASFKKWKFEVLDLTDAELGGCRVSCIKIVAWTHVATIEMNSF